MHVASSKARPRRNVFVLKHMPSDPLRLSCTLSKSKRWWKRKLPKTVSKVETFENAQFMLKTHCFQCGLLKTRKRTSVFKWKCVSVDRWQRQKNVCVNENNLLRFGESENGGFWKCINVDAGALMLSLKGNQTITWRFHRFYWRVLNMFDLCRIFFWSNVVTCLCLPRQL